MARMADSSCPLDRQDIDWDNSSAQISTRIPAAVHVDRLPGNVAVSVIENTLALLG